MTLRRLRRPVVGYGALLLAVVLVGCTSKADPALLGATSQTHPVVVIPPPVKPPWVRTLKVAFPADLIPAASGATCSPADTAPGWTRREEARRDPTSPSTAFVAPAAPSGVLVDRTSYVCGQTIVAKISLPDGVGQVRLLRLGWYGGAGARTVASIDNLALHQQDRTISGTDGYRAADWTTSATFPVTAAFEPGVYQLQVQTSTGSVLASTVLVIRSPRATSRLAELVSFLTFTAYNKWGGSSLYFGHGSNPVERQLDHARQVSFIRPFDAYTTRQFSFYFRPLQRQVARTGVDVDYLSDLDLDSTPSLFSHRVGIVIGSHAEYWTSRMYDTVIAARNSGTNLAFLGANQIYWQGRLAARDREGQPRTLIVYRTFGDDEAAALAPATASVRWRDPPLFRPESALIGQMYVGLGVSAGLIVRSVPAWMAGIVRPGTVLFNAAGGELDHLQIPRISPPHVQVIAEGFGRLRNGSQLSGSMTYYVAPSGALVFAGGSMYWGCLMEGFCPAMTAPTATITALVKITDAVLTVIAQPRAGLRYPVTMTPYLDARQLIALLPQDAIGSQLG